MQHLDDAQLQAWLDRDRSGISQAEAAEVENHVGECEACAARLAELEATSTRARSLLAVAAPAAEGPPDFAEVVRRSRRRAPSGGGGRWWMAAGWAASLVVATGLGWLSHDLLRPGPEADTPSAVAEAERSVAAAPQPVEVEPDAAAAAREAAADPDPEITVAPTTFADAAAPGQFEAEPESLRVQGQVRAEDGSPLASAQVTIQGSALGTMTGADGTFSLPVPADALAEPAAPAAVEMADESREVWTPVTRTHAESQAGFAVLIVPELAIAEIELGEVRGAVAVRVRQALDSGATLTLVQQRADGSAGEPTLPAGQPAETVERHGLRITGSAPMVVDSLKALLGRVR